MHDAARLVWLSDQIDQPGIALHRPGLQVHFYIIAAEMVAKRWADFQREGESKKHVRLFFQDLCSSAHRDSLAQSFRVGSELLSWEGAVDLLYGVRCDVAHEGQYYNFSMASYPGENMLWVNTDYDNAVEAVVTVYLTPDQLREIILEGAIEAARKLVP